MIPHFREYKSYTFPERLLQVLIIFFTTLTFSYLFLLLGSYLSFYLFDFSIMNLGGQIPEAFEPNEINGYKFTQVFYHLGTFLAPPLFMMLILKRNAIEFFGLNNNKLSAHYLWVIAIWLVSYPLVAWLIEWNLSFDLSFLKNTGDWLVEKEKEAEALTEQLLNTTTFAGLLSNLFVFALLPAITEEIYFRGLVLRMFLVWRNNKHLAVWVSAAIFSFIHFQFLGFFPRMMLGLLLGYIFVWTGNLRLSMLFHFINNGIAVVVSFMFMNGYTNLDPNMTVSGWIGIIGLIATILIMLAFRKRNNLLNLKVVNEVQNDSIEWVLLWQSTDAISAEFKKDHLIAEGYDAYILNKKDSSYGFGDVELYVPKHQYESAKNALKI